MSLHVVESSRYFQVQSSMLQPVPARKMKTTPLLASPLNLGYSPRTPRTPNSTSTSHSCPSPAPPPLSLSPSLINFPSRSADPVRTESLGSLTDVRRYVAYTLRPGSEEMWNLMRSGLSSKELNDVMRRMAWLEPHELVDSLACHQMRANRYVAKLSSRFEAVVTRWKGRYVWFTRIEHRKFAFALSLSSSNEFRVSPKIEPVRRISLPDCSITWENLQQRVVWEFDDDDHVRAILAACLLSCDFDGKYSCVVRNLVPNQIRCLSTCITFDTPVDWDIVTVLADTHSSYDGIYFNCAGGFRARLRNNSHLSEQDAAEECYISHLEPMLDPITGSSTQVSMDHICVPFLYGFGESLNCQNPANVNSTKQVTEIFDRVQSPQLRLLLRLFTQLAPNLVKDGKLDLTAGVNELRQREGTKLGKEGRTRRIRNDVIIIRADGLYRSSRFSGGVAQGHVGMSALFIKAGVSYAQPVGPDERRIATVSEVASFLLGKEYTSLHRENRHTVMGPQDDPWGDDVAIANSIAVLLCRTYGPLEGFGHVAYKPWDVWGQNTNNLRIMNANVFLPMLHAFEDPIQQIEREFWAWYCIWCLLTCFVFDICHIFRPLKRKNIYDKVGTSFLLWKLYGRKKKLVGRVGEKTLYITENPFLEHDDENDDTVTYVYASL